MILHSYPELDVFCSLKRQSRNNEQIWLQFEVYQTFSSISYSNADRWVRPWQSINMVPQIASGKALPRNAGPQTHRYQTTTHTAPGK